MTKKKETPAPQNAQHADALRQLGVPGSILNRAAALGINWGSILSKLLPIILEIVATAGSQAQQPAATEEPKAS